MNTVYCQSELVEDKSTTDILKTSITLRQAQCYNKPEFSFF